MNSHGWRKFVFCAGGILLTSALFVWAHLPAEAWQTVVVICVLAYVGGNVTSKFSKEAGAWDYSRASDSPPQPPPSQP